MSRLHCVPIATASSIVLDRLAEVACQDSGIKQLFTLLAKKGGRWAVVGGAPRAWLLNGARPRDLDLVSTLSVSALHARVRELAAQPDGANLSIAVNSFGGVKIRFSTYDVDLWSATDTFGVRERWVSHAWPFRAVALCAPTSVDSIVVTMDGVIHENMFFDSWRCSEIRYTGRSAGFNERLAIKVVKLSREYSFQLDVPLTALVRRFYPMKDPGGSNL